MDRETTLAALVERCDGAAGEGNAAAVLAARADGDALAEAVGGELARRWYVVVIRALMLDPPDGDVVRELYGELVDRYRDQPEHLAALRPLGDAIRAAEASGALPSALVARSERRTKHTT